MDEFTELAVQTLRIKFSEMIDHIVERLSGGKIFRNSLISNLQKFIDDFQVLNINNDEELSKLIEKCKSVIKGVNSQMVRDDDRLRSHIAEKMTEVKQKMDTFLVDRPVRKLKYLEDM